MTTVLYNYLITVFLFNYTDNAYTQFNILAIHTECTDNGHPVSPPALFQGANRVHKQPAIKCPYILQSQCGPVLLHHPI